MPDRLKRLESDGLWSPNISRMHAYVVKDCSRVEARLLLRHDGPRQYGQEPLNTPVKNWLYRRIIEPVLALLRQGISPDRLALCVAIGVVVGNIPILGVSTILCAAIALAFRLNLPAIQIVQAAMAPTQLLLIIPFVRLGEWILRVPPERVSINEVLAVLAHGAGRAIAVFWDAILHAGLAWVVIAPFAVYTVYKLLRPVFRRAAAQLE